MMKKIRLVCASCACACVLVTSTSTNASVFYNYTGNNYDIIPGGGYDTSMSIGGSLELTSELAPLLNNAVVAPIAFSFSDGINTITDSTAENASFKFSTDSFGNIVAWDLFVDTPFPAPTSVGDTKSSMSSIFQGGGTAGDTAMIETCTAVTAGVCFAPVVTSSAVAESAGTWTVVPIPATVWLFGSGLLGLISISSSKKTV